MQIRNSPPSCTKHIGWSEWIRPTPESRGWLQGQEEEDFPSPNEFWCSAEIQKDVSQPCHTITTPMNPSHEWIQPSQIKQITHQSSKRLLPPISPSQNWKMGSQEKQCTYNQVSLYSIIPVENYFFTNKEEHFTCLGYWGSLFFSQTIPGCALWF